MCSVYSWVLKGNGIIWDIQTSTNSKFNCFLFVTATSGSGNGNSSDSADLYKANRNFFLQLDLRFMAHVLLYDIQTYSWYFLFSLKCDKNMIADFCISSTNSHKCCIIYINISYSFPLSLFLLI